MRITNISKKVQVVTGKYDTVVVTPFGRWTVEDHETGIREAQAYVTRHA